MRSGLPSIQALSAAVRPRRSEPCGARPRSSATLLSGLMSPALTLVVALGLGVGLVGCTEHFTNPGAADDAGADGGGSDAGGDLFNGDGVGSDCTSDASCRDGLVCSSGTCRPSGKRKDNEVCILSAECGAASQCGFFGFCVPSAKKPAGAVCSSVSDCAKGLYCDLKGISGVCATPSDKAKDLYGACKQTRDCMAGLHCGEAGMCLPGSITLNPDLFAGVACPVRAEEELAFQARNVIPRSGAADLDFYSTPFPSDLRRTAAGKVDLSAHPRPGKGLLGLDLVGNIIDAIDAELTGFSVAPAVYFRWTRPLEPASIVTVGPTRNIFFVDLTPGLKQPDVKYTAAFHAERNKYICGNWLAVHASWRRPLKNKTTYAVFVTDSVRAALPEGAEPKLAIPERGDDLPLLLGDKTPKDPVEKLAWQRYAPLRKYLETSGQAPGKVVAATVFTTQDATRVMREFNGSANLAKSPTIVGAVHRCGVSKGASPCATPGWKSTKAGKSGAADPRDCPKDAAKQPFHELHFKLKLPMYQQGKRPYLSSGGGLKLSGNRPQITGYEDVCASLTVPKATMPGAGWPVLIYAHGTGGSHRAGVAQMGKLVSGLPGGVKMAMLGIDQPMHGSRRGAPLDPGGLFYNFANPSAAKGNFYQGAADNFALVRFLRGYKGSLPGPGTVRFNTARILYMGHSQGGSTGPLFAPFALNAKKINLVHAHVFSGTGAGLVFSLLNKKSPSDATIGIKLALQELDIGPDHPGLALFQYYFDEVDPLTYAPLLYDTSIGSPVHVLHTYGQNDTYTPPETSRVFAAATRGWMLRQPKVGKWFDFVSDLGMTNKEHTASVAGNLKRTWNKISYKITGVTIQHLNDPKRSFSGKPYDGHFIAFRDKLCNKQVGTFLSTAVSKGIPLVPNK